MDDKRCGPHIDLLRSANHTSQFFLTSTCIICALVSVMTGSSWTTIATIGIALMGIGKAQGFEEGWIAGAIISGAYFGDKISPLSDTTILAASVTDTPLFRHIRYMLITTVPSLIITLVIFTVAGLSHNAGSTEHIAEFSAALAGKFHITPWLLIVPVVTGVLIARRVLPSSPYFCRRHWQGHSPYSSNPTCYRKYPVCKIPKAHSPSSKD